MLTFQLFYEKIIQDLIGLGLGGLQVVVDDNAVEAWSEREFVGRAVEALLNDFRGISASTFQPLAQSLNTAYLTQPHIIAGLCCRR